MWMAGYDSNASYAVHFQFRQVTVYIPTLSRHDSHQ